MSQPTAMVTDHTVPVGLSCLATIWNALTAGMNGMQVISVVLTIAYTSWHLYDRWHKGRQK